MEAGPAVATQPRVDEAIHRQFVELSQVPKATLQRLTDEAGNFDAVLETSQWRQYAQIMDGIKGRGRLLSDDEYGQVRQRLEKL